MGKKKKKVPRLTEAQYNEYIMSIKDDASAYSPNGGTLIPPQVRPQENKDKD